ncbi:MAG: type II secretion system protein GspC [Pseudobdellovibrio sp.]
MKIGKSGKEIDNKRIATFALYALLAFIAFSIADLTIIYFRDRFIPDQAPPKKMSTSRTNSFADRSQYSVIANRNLFSSTGVMPNPIGGGSSGPKKNNNTPVPSQLPITVIGTLVHSDPSKSIAALDLKTKNKTGSYSTGADIEGLGTLEKVQRGIIFIRNSSNGLLEYIEMNKAGNKVNFDTAKAAPVKAKGTEVVNSGNNTFSIQRSNLLKYTNDLSSVLMQARAVPNRDPNTGEINGFRILDMQPGSIYEQLGLQRMDVIKGVNGEPVDSIQKAMEMYNTLKNGAQVKLQIERGGKTDTFTYDIK